MRSLEQLMRLDGRVALITGGAGHIGSAMAETLAELGCQLCLLDCDESHLEQVRARIATSFGVRVETVACDLEKEAARAQLLTRGTVGVRPTRRPGEQRGIRRQSPARGVGRAIRAAKPRHLAACLRGEPDGRVPPVPGVRAIAASGRGRVHRERRVDLCGLGTGPRALRRDLRWAIRRPMRRARAVWCR